MRTNPNRARRAILAALTVPAALACGGLGGPESAPVPPMLHPVERDGSCVLVELPAGTARATFEGTCAGYTISVDPTNPEKLLVRMGTRPGRLDDAPLPALPAGEPDMVGFATDGRIVALVRHEVEATLDAKLEEAWVVIEGKRFEMDYWDAEMFGIVACDAYALEDGSWNRFAGPAPVQLHEGMSQPWCVGMDDAPMLAPLIEPGTSQWFPTEDVFEAPPALAALGEGIPDLQWHKLSGLDAASNGLWFEGLMLNTPLAVGSADTWRLLDLPPDRPLSLYRRGLHLLACTPDTAVVFDTSSDFTEVWRGGGPCPVFWPPGPDSEP